MVFGKSVCYKKHEHGKKWKFEPRGKMIVVSVNRLAQLGDLAVDGCSSNGDRELDGNEQVLSFFMTTSKPEYQLFTSLRYDPKLLSASFNTEVCGSPSQFLLFPYHVDRLVTAANFFQWPKAIEVISAQGAADLVKKKCEEAVSAHPSDKKEQNGLRVRCMLSIWLEFLFTMSSSLTDTYSIGRRRDDNRANFRC